jgi:uncharacterized protein YbjT (DUF2867 family)
MNVLVTGATGVIGRQAVRVCNQAFRQAASWQSRYRSVAAGWPTIVIEDRRSP